MEFKGTDESGQISRATSRSMRSPTRSGRPWRWLFCHKDSCGLDTRKRCAFSTSVREGRLVRSRPFSNRNRAAQSLPPDPAPIEESPAAEEQDHDKDDEERVGVHDLILTAGGRYVCTLVNTREAN